MWTILKIFFEFVPILLLGFFFFNVLVFWPLLAPRAGIGPVRPALEDGVLTTGPPGKTLEPDSFVSHSHAASEDEGS